MNLKEEKQMSKIKEKIEDMKQEAEVKKNERRAKKEAGKSFRASQKELEITRMTQIFTNFSMKKYEIAINNKFA